MIRAGAVTFEGSGTVEADEIIIDGGATLSGAGDRYLKSGVTPITVDGTLNYTGLQDGTRTVTLDGGSGLIFLGANLTASVGTPAFTGSMSGSGGLTKVGAGQLRVNNSFTGPASVYAGYLALDNIVSGGLSVAADAGVAFVQPSDLVSVLNAPSSTFQSNALAGLYVEDTLTNPNLTGVDFDDLRFLKMGPGRLTLSQPAVLANLTSGVVVAEGQLQYSVANAVAAGMPIKVDQSNLATGLCPP
ncbi:MAG: hypothetical protein PHO37_09560 [Kiritimatiellae bacterium]|nr:hypothetical protein [Kiritimatiellia bacterium]